MNKVELLQRAKPILFNVDMVQAILKNKKTVTRRIVKYYGRTPTMDGKDKFYKIDENLNGTNPNRLYAGFYNDNDVFEYKGETMIDAMYYPLYFKVGDILYVRETFAHTWRPDSNDIGFIYKADGEPQEFPYWGNVEQSKVEVWIPSIHMSKKAARIFLKVKDVYVERLQEISNWDIKHEGLPYSEEKINFIELWNSTIKKQDFKKYSWDANPWVWVIEFEKVEIGDE